MITFYPLIKEQIPIWKDNISTLLEEYRFVLKKLDVKVEKIVYPLDFQEFESWILFIIEDVDVSNENLAGGQVALSAHPGDWILTLESKTTISTTWTEVFKDVVKMFKRTQINVYNP